MCNETSATINAWKAAVRRLRKRSVDAAADLHARGPRRRRLKASLQSILYRFRDGVLDITIRPDLHVRIELRSTKNPLFARYLAASDGTFGLAVTDRALIFNFHVENEQPVRGDSVGIDLNLVSADHASSDGVSGAVSLKEIAQIQRRMDRKRRSVQAAIPTDLRLQRRKLRRLRDRQRHRVDNRLHAAANGLLAAAGDRNIVFEDLTDAGSDCVRKARGKERRRRLNAWAYGALQRIVAYKSRTAVVRVNPRGTSSECPRCGGPLDRPSWRRATCGPCQAEWHRDRGAAINILVRGHACLRGQAPALSALNALLEAARWRSERNPTGGAAERGRSECGGGCLVTSSSRRGA